MTACEPWLPPRIRIDLALVASRPAKVAARSTRARRTGLPVTADLAARERGRGLVERDEHAAREAAQDPVGEARHAVLLLDRRRVARQRGGEHERPRGVAADAEHDVGPQAAQDAPRVEEGARAGAAARAASPREPHALEPAHLDQLERETGLRHQAASRGPRAVPTKSTSPPGRGDRLGDGDPGIEMAAGSAARDEDAQRLVVAHSSGGASTALGVVGCGRLARLGPTSMIRRGPASRRRLRALAGAVRAGLPLVRLGVARRDVGQHAGHEEAHHQRRAAVADERQRQTLRRQRSQHDADVHQRLQPEHRA